MRYTRYIAHIAPYLMGEMHWRKREVKLKKSLLQSRILHIFPERKFQTLDKMFHLFPETLLLGFASMSVPAQHTDKISLPFLVPNVRDFQEI